jgi:succinate dehydrogenase flavin-adding protein (antitoxin of CptAB toxin-antitoxin module)
MMTRVQWLFEFHSLKDREESLLDAVVSLLGLKIGRKEKVVPLSMLVGNPKILQHFAKEAETEEAVDDEAFDKFSDLLAKGDLDPLFELPEEMSPEENWDSPDVQQTLDALGIKRDG